MVFTTQMIAILI